MPISIFFSNIHSNLLSIISGIAIGGSYGLCLCLQHNLAFSQDKKRSSVTKTLLRFLSHPTIRLILFPFCLVIVLRWQQISPILTMIAAFIACCYVVIQQGVLRLRGF